MHASHHRVLDSDAAFNESVHPRSVQRRTPILQELTCSKGLCLQDKMVEVTKEVVVEKIKNVTVPGTSFF